MFSTFGPMLFCKDDGTAADYGQLSFFTNNATSTAQWLTVSGDTPAGILVNFAEKYWKLPKPEVLITVLGEARGLSSISLQVRGIFEIGLVKAVSAAKAWVVTGGAPLRLHPLPPPQYIYISSPGPHNDSVLLIRCRD